MRSDWETTGFEADHWSERERSCSSLENEVEKAVASDSAPLWLRGQRRRRVLGVSACCRNPKLRTGPERNRTADSWVQTRCVAASTTGPCSGDECKHSAAWQQPEVKETPPKFSPLCMRGQRRRRVLWGLGLMPNPHMKARRYGVFKSSANCAGNAKTPAGFRRGLQEGRTLKASDHPGGPGRLEVRWSFLLSPSVRSRFPFTVLAMTNDGRAWRPRHHDIDTCANARVVDMARCLVVEGDMALSGG